MYLWHICGEKSNKCTVVKSQKIHNGEKSNKCTEEKSQTNATNMRPKKTTFAQFAITVSGLVLYRVTRTWGSWNCRLVTDIHYHDHHNQPDHWSLAKAFHLSDLRPQGFLRHLSLIVLATKNCTKESWKLTKNSLILPGTTWPETTSARDGPWFMTLLNGNNEWYVLTLWY